MIVLCTNAQNYVYQNVYSIILLPTFFRELQSMPKVLGISHQSKNCFESTSRLYKLPKVCSRIPERKLISSLERKVSSSHYSRVRSGYKIRLKILSRELKQVPYFRNQYPPLNCTRPRILPAPITWSEEQYPPLNCTRNCEKT